MSETTQATALAKKINSDFDRAMNIFRELPGDSMKIDWALHTVANFCLTSSEELCETQAVAERLTKELESRATPSQLGDLIVEVEDNKNHIEKLAKVNISLIDKNSDLNSRIKELEAKQNEMETKQKWKFSMMGFQAQVGVWIVECFGRTTAFDQQERNWRFIEEAIELVQSLGAKAEDVHTMVDHTFNREKGEPSQEVGGVMVTLAGLCEANKLSIYKDATTEFERIDTPEMMNKIRAKHASKPHKSPLPGDYKYASPETTKEKK